ncbi:tripartite tricarboxylate transporter TctB family protein [Ancylobacter sp. WKF20]|uniref:tripartite tricarboxylate transporter TctB family protein n=1 Tax=Ancylobacter sp. WKF20 TaxID=3039801 RepID=UPI002434345E|nr:tripartite tricarboxylate transporter TctB family protein [Ancylobacter sp. WKF20]WGD30585.1 tripartite tricarboxylate transporter TctB family protein [Ancylobacter sp. WKF20]
MNKDGWSGLVLLALAGAYYVATGSIANSTLEDEVGAIGLPHALAVVLALIGIAIFLRGLRAGRAPADPHDEEDADVRLPRALGFLAFGAVYVLILPFAGYLVSVALLIGAVALYEGAPRRWTVPAAAIGGAILYWAVFVKLLGVNQPAGTLFAGLFS